MEDIYYFYVTGKLSVIDQAIQKDGAWYGVYSHKSLEETQKAYPGAIVISSDNFDRAICEKAKLPPEEITEKDFEDALECLPPLGWVGDEDSESFKMSEFFVADITTIYVRIKDNDQNRYFSFSDVCTMPHSEVVKFVRNSEVYRQPLPVSG